MTAAAVEALRDLWEADDHVTSDQFRTGPRGCADESSAGVCSPPPT